MKLFALTVMTFGLLGPISSFAGAETGSVLHTCGPLVLMYERSRNAAPEFYVDGLDINSKFWLVDSSTNATYAVVVTDPNSEGANFEAKDDKGRVFARFESVDWSGHRRAILATGEKIPCTLTRPSRE